jgi:three-Cys-motif partner protein
MSKSGCRKKNGNCTLAVDPLDELPVQCVRAWASDKHYYLRRVVDATRHVRAKFNPPQGRGGSCFVDLFAGPGRARILKPAEFVDGSPLVAIKAAAENVGAYSRVVLCDIDEENVRALEARTASLGTDVRFVLGDCNVEIDKIAAQIPPHAFTQVLVDPFGPSALHFSTIKRLSQFAHLDFIIHWPVGSMKRNFEAHAVFEKVLGLPAEQWKDRVKRGSDIAALLPLYRSQLATLGYVESGMTAPMTAPAIKNSHNLTLYRLIFASKDPLGYKIWSSVTRKQPDGQTSFGGLG